MKLIFAIPEIFIVDQWKTYSFYLKKCAELLKQSLTSITAAQNLAESILITTERNARFHLFNFFSYTYCIRQTMFEGKTFSKDGKAFDALVNDWKNESIVRIIIGVRTKYQYGSLMEIKSELNIIQMDLILSLDIILNPLSRIIEEFIQSCDKMTTNLDGLFEKAFAQELSQKKAMKDEYDKIESWFEDRGMYALKA